MPATSPPVARPGRRPVLRAALALWGTVVLATGFVTAGASGPPVAGQVPTDACVDVDTFISVKGSTSAKAAFTAWGPAICDSADVVAEYAASSSKEGREELIAGNAAISLSTLPFGVEEGEALAAAERGVVQIPILATAAVCGYWDKKGSDPGYPQGKNFPDLRLSRHTIARLLGGDDMFTDDPGLAEDNADNPDFPGGRQFLTAPFYVRGGFSALNYELGRWIVQDEEAEAAFLAEADQRLPGAELPFEEFPPQAASNPIALPEYSVIQSRMFQTSPGAEGNFLGIGCMDNGTARTDARPDTPDVVEVVNRAWLENAAGAFVAPVDEAVTEAVEAMVPNGDGTFRPDPELESETAYGLPMVVSAGLATCGVDQATRDGMEAIVRYTIGAGQEALPDGNVPLPDAMVETAERRLADWEEVVQVGTCGEEPPPPPTTTGTTTPATTAPVVTDPPFVDPGTAPPPVDELVPGSDVGPDGSFAGGSTDGGSSGTGTGVVPDTAAFDDVVAAAGGGGGDLGAGTGGGEETAAAAAPAEAVASEPTEPAEGPLGPIARVVAMARGSSALPPLVLLVAGLALLIVGPVLQTGDALGRATSLPASARRWFGRLRP